MNLDDGVPTVDSIKTEVCGTLNYRYVTAWHLLGGVNLPPEATTLELYADSHRKFFLTSTPDAHLEGVDRASIIANLMLRGIFNGEQIGDLVHRIDDDLLNFREERRKRFGQGTFLIFEASGETGCASQSIARQVEDFAIAFDVVDKDTIRKAYREDILAMKLALGLEGQSTVRFEVVADGTVLVDDKGRRVFSFSMNGGIDELSVSSAIKAESREKIAGRFGRLRMGADIESVQRLFAEMADRKVDRLRRFMTGWAALEILVVKAFKKYEQAFLLPLVAAGQTSLRERFLDRLRTVMGDKYRVMDKFLVVSSMLFPDADFTSQEADVACFKGLKEMRDGIFHGQPFADEDLHVDDVEQMLRKYLSAYVDTISMQENIQ